MGLSNKLLQLFKYISFFGTSEKSTDYENNFTILINQYLVLLSIIFFVFGLIVFLHVGLENNGIFLITMSIYWLLAFLLKEHRKNKYVITITFTILSLIITYYSSLASQNSGIFLFYFSLITAIPFFYDLNKDKAFIYFIIFFNSLSIYISIIYDFQLVPTDPIVFENNYSKSLMLLSTTLSILINLINYSMIEKKKTTEFMLQKSLTIKSNTIKNLIKEKEKLINIHYISNNLTNEEIKKLVTLAQNNDPFFLEKFQKYFPYFFNKLEKMCPKLLITDLHLCALIKLNLDTKQIALYTNSSIKSIESRKYRLRKKLNLPAGVDTNIWFLNI